MEITDFIEPQRIHIGVKATSKKQILEVLARNSSLETGLAERTIFDVLIERERLGTTGVGRRIAIPHGRIARLKTLHGIFLQLDKPVEFDSVDDEPVDLIFLLLAPKGAGAEHLKALSKISRLLSDSDRCERLRKSETKEKVFEILTER
ncbi:MAG: PTS IIA-like nitrogen regulatory protein PtsN [Alphaproteobacteria bacterium]